MGWSFLCYSSVISDGVEVGLDSGFSGVSVFALVLGVVFGICIPALSTVKFSL